MPSIPRSSIVLAALVASAAARATTVECSVATNIEERVVTIDVATTPYQFTKADFDYGFRFAGQVLADPPRLRTYAYVRAKDRHVLAHRGAVALDPKACGRDLGSNAVYSPGLELEMTYTCRLKCE